MGRRPKRAQNQRVARERMERLLGLAEDATPERADSYAGLARRIGMRYQVSMPPALRPRICRACDSFLRPGRNARVRVTSCQVRVSCLTCGHIARYGVDAKEVVRARG